MAGTLHFIALTGLAAFTIAAVVRGFSRPTVLRMVAAAGATIASFFVGLLFVHACDSGLPFMQWSIPMLCIVGSILFVGRRRPRVALVIGAGLVMFGLCFHFTEIVHGADWIGNPDSLSLERAATGEWHTFLTGLFRR